MSASASAGGGRGPGGATWTVIGAGSILPRVGHGPAGYALRAGPGAPVTLFDCGPGTLRSLAGVGIGLDEVRRIVISHFHVDHWLDLFAVAFARRNPALASVPPLELVGPRGLERRLELGQGVFGPGVAFTETIVREVEPTTEISELQLDGLVLAHVHTMHTDTSLAWRATLPAGPSVTYTGDTREVDQVAELARDTDLFVAECSFPDEDGVPGHLTPSSAARLARAAGARRLLLTHFYPSLEPERARATAARTFTGPIDVACDGSVHPLR
ncbi:MAG: ribonuclease Z [Planctomycetota bacterium]|nr:MAG: ribonuclease Z [Planctomycetota bacterium]